MNAIRQIQALNKRELESAVSSEASWHADYRDTAYIYIGGLPFDISEGDILTVFSQYGEPVHLNLVRDKETGKSRGFAFLKYEDQRSTDLAVDNLGGATVLGRTLRVDHVRYKRREDEGLADNLVEMEQEIPETRSKHEKEGEVRNTPKKSRRDYDSDDEPRHLRPLLKEEIELQHLIEEHDDEDPMKEYLIREKKEEVENALALVKTKPSGSRKDRGERDRREHRHRHRHRSGSRERHRRRKSASNERPGSRERRHHRRRSSSKEQPREHRHRHDRRD
ncbi:hypothetical protein FQN57_003917 [Myotisia sp. PD_48]|nr:hypothetical protein FQN57_003917 [Myotisia sp. PD_48]